MKPQKQNIKFLYFIFFILIVLFIITPLFGFIIGAITIIFFSKSKSSFIKSLNKIYDATDNSSKSLDDSELLDLEEISDLESVQDDLIEDNDSLNSSTDEDQILLSTSTQTGLEKRKKYLHIALNNSMDEARNIINQLPSSDRILIEVGTPMIKNYGVSAIEQIKSLAPTGTYIVADNKCTDLAAREVQMVAEAGANASTCLGIAPIETIDEFIKECDKAEIDSMIDMMNVEDSLSVLKKLKKLPDVVILHRGVDETESAKANKSLYIKSNK